ncbi:MAG: hypothetical protein JXR97_02280 [Planctomycetes bacterium]|nr:hypothetical protein [Planctomycetota bacterium]
MYTLLRRFAAAFLAMAFCYAMLSSYSIQPIASAYLFQATVILFLGVWVCSRKYGSVLNRSFFCYALTISLYLLLVYLLHLASEIGVEKVVFYVWLLRFGFILAAPTLINFTCNLIGAGRRFTKLFTLAALVSVLPFVVANLAGVYVSEYRLAGLTYVPAGDLSWYRAFALAFMFWSAVSIIMVVVTLIRSKRSAHRAQCILFLVGWGGALGYALSGFLPAIHKLYFPSLSGIVWSMLPLSLGIAILRYELFEFKLILRRTLPYAIGTAFIGCMYAALIVALDHIMSGDIFNRDWQHLAGFLLVMGLCFQPVMELVREYLDRIFFREEAVFDHFIAELSDRLMRCRRLDNALNVVRESLQNYFMAERACVLFSENDGAPLLASCSDAADDFADSPVLARLRSASCGSEGENCPVFLQPDELFEGSGWHGAFRFVTEGGAGAGLLGEKRSHLSYHSKDRMVIKAVARQYETAVLRILAEDRAAIAASLVDNLLTALDSPVALVEGRNRILRSNSAFGQIFESTSLEGSSLAALLDKWDWRKVIEIEYGGRAYLLNCQPVELEAERKGELLIFTDITELRRLRDREQRNAVLTELGMTVSSINHEIQNIITPISFQLDKLRQNIADAKGLDRIDKVMERFSLLDRLSQELRQYYKSVEYQPRKTNLKSIVDSAMTDLKSHVSDFVPPAMDGLDLTMNVDPQKFKQVIYNLMKNAWDAMAEGAARDWSVSAVVEGGAVSITVADSGPGIPHEMRERIFEPFFSTKKERGTGLGLPVCRRIVEGHGGSLSAESEPGKGAAMIITMPAA